MKMARVISTYDGGHAYLLRDDDGQCYDVMAEAEGRLALNIIDHNDIMPPTSDTTVYGCAVGEWNPDDTITVRRRADDGEQFNEGDAVWEATPDGWICVEAEEE